MGKNKMIAKSCPKCDQQVAVATKICKCGHSFFSGRRHAATASPRRAEDGEAESGARRTARVRRARPHFYDSQDYQRAKKKSKRRSASTCSYEEKIRDRSKDSSKDSVNAQRGRRRGLKDALATPDRRTKAAAVEPPPPAHKLLRCSTLLGEINRKMAAVTWTPVDIDMSET